MDNIKKLLLDTVGMHLIDSQTIFSSNYKDTLIIIKIQLNPIKPYSLINNLLNYLKVMD